MKLSHQEFVQDKNNIKKLVILLHGYGSNGENLLVLAPEISKSIPEAKFIAPNATYNCDIGMKDSYQWFSLAQHDPIKMSTEIVRSNDILNNFIKEQLDKHVLTKKDLILIGFSQGAMMSMYTSLKSNEEPAAIISLSGRLILPNEINSKPKICLVHGSDDDVVDYHFLSEAEEGLAKLGINYESHSLNNLGHSIDYRVIKIIQNYIKKIS
ncbi:MAG: phospholipase/carboxylesterase [Rickettsiales bacterium]|jgi:phospholipase/carboxylesterase